MRGNRLADYPQPVRRGSIPAYAGEPLAVSGPSPAPGVYPRVCGGTVVSETAAGGVKGLSPRMRGNQADDGLLILEAGSIPAYAGEPIRAAATWNPVTVYPRVCGGTVPSFCCSWPGHGLSPRMRGNRPIWTEWRRSLRSIPAYAGEPYCPPPRCPAMRGLSPRMRGNREYST